MIIKDGRPAGDAVRDRGPIYSSSECGLIGIAFDPNSW
jgi:hypothetical protein